MRYTLYIMSLHDKIIDLRNDLGYPEDDEGLCAGIAQNVIQAFILDKALLKLNPNLIGNEEFSKYYHRLTFIDQHYKTLVKDINDVRDKLKADKDYKPSPSEWNLLDIAAFIDNIDVYTNSIDYTDLFDQIISQSDVPKIASYIQPELLKELGGTILNYNFTRMFYKQLLKDYCDVLKNTLFNLPTDLAISISTGTHRISICYDKQLDLWICTDAKNLPPFWPVDGDLFAWLTNACKVTDSNRVCLNFKFYSSGNRQEEVNQFVTQFKQEIERNGLYNIPKDTINRRSDNGISLAYLAAKQNDLETLQQMDLIKDDFNHTIADFNIRTSDKIAPIAAAVSHNLVDVIVFLASLKAPAGTRIVDFNITDKCGDTLMHRALRKNLDMVEILMSFKKPDQTLEVDLTQANREGETTLMLAALYGHADLLLSMLKQKTSTGDYIDSTSLKNINYTYLEDDIKLIIEATENRDFLLNLVDMMKTIHNDHPSVLALSDMVIKAYESDYSQLVKSHPTYTMYQSMIENYRKPDDQLTKKRPLNRFYKSKEEIDENEEIDEKEVKNSTNTFSKRQKGNL